MRTIVITIGRNIRGNPMPLKQWRMFRGAVYEALLDNNAIIIQQPSDDPKRSHDQVGVWQGVEEPACTFVALGSKDYRYINRLHNDLQALAVLYEQDAIGYINVPGTDHVVTPDPWERKMLQGLS